MSDDSRFIADDNITVITLGSDSAVHLGLLPADFLKELSFLAQHAFARRVCSEWQRSNSYTFFLIDHF